MKHDPAQDARGFLRWLLHHGRPNVAVRDCALYESAALQMQRSHRRFKMGLFTLPSAPTRFLAVWWRVCRQQPCRYFQWPRT